MATGGSDDRPDDLELLNSANSALPQPYLTSGTFRPYLESMTTNAFATAALAAARAHNVLTAEDRAAFEACTDASESECWATLVVHDLSMRCRSFTPAVLTNLVELGRACGAVA